MIKIKMKKIIDLTSIFLRDSYQNIDIINTKTYKINKKSVYVWMIAILFLALFFVSDKIIQFLVSRGQAEIFLNVYFLILAILMMFQTILVCTNIFYFSKDLELVLPLPITPVELLIAKFNTLICKLYISEIIFGIIPITMYGLLTNASTLFYLYELIVFAIFPIFLALIVSMIMMFVMKISKFIKNKDLFQIIMTLLLMVVLFAVEYKIMGSMITNEQQIETADEQQVLEKIMEFNDKIKESNQYFLVVNPCVQMLTEANLSSILQIVKLFLINFITFILFILIGKITYLKDILKNTAYLTNKNNKKTNLQKKCKARNIRKSYIFKEFKSLFRNPMFFMQCIYPVLIWLITLTIMSSILIPKIELAFSSEEFRETIGEISFDITAVYLILGVIQILFMMSPASLTAISREGKNAMFMKYIPISFYKQFIYKGIPQVFINTISVIVVLGIIHYAIPSIEMMYIFMVFILAMLLNIINSYSMLIVDLLKPKLDWDTEYAVLKQNNNKIFQYVFTVFIILLLIYLNKVLDDVSLVTSISVTGMVFTAVIVIINIFGKIKQNKLFEKII
jgi:ABC-2 type transport system permease protein